MSSPYIICVAFVAFTTGVLPVLGAGRQKFSLDLNWKFALNDAPSGGFGPACSANAWTKNLNDQQCDGLQQVGGAKDEDDCARACCNSATCEVYQWCNTTNCMPSAQDACWIGRITKCTNSKGWVSKGRTAAPAPPPSPGTCSDPRCKSNFVDTNWSTINVPHDFIVEGVFNATTGDKSHGYLPYNKGWYRKHFTIPSSLRGQTIYIEFDGTQANTQVYLNDVTLGGHASGYTPYRFKLNQRAVKFDADNVLAVFVDATHPDGWWYDGGGIYRHVWLTAVAPVHVEPWGVYAPALVTGSIARVSTSTSDLQSPTSASGGRLQASTATVLPQVEVGNESPSTVTATVTGVVYGPDGSVVVGTSNGHVTVPSGGNATVALPTVDVANAALWSVSITVDGDVTDTVNVTFGIRKAEWKAATGFYLNDEPTKILGNANHQDFAGVGVAVPDVLQAHRIGKLQEMNSNGWRTAHNVPTEALLDAADEMGFLVWDENHRNGQDSEVEILVRRDRNHPSVVIWSLCNEVLCNTNDMKGDMTRLKALIRSLDPHGQRVVSANNNAANGADTPLDLQGFDYNTGSYDAWHARAPNISAISSETSSAVSDRDEIKNEKTQGVVSGYDDAAHGNTVPWGQSAEGAWGGVGMANGQGILTRAFMAGGFTWTGWDYKGEPTPYAWPDINSHFGIIDEAGFPKDRFYWYKAWFGQPSPPSLHVFPHWNWNAGDNIDVWAYCNADEVELLVNGKSLGKSPSGNYSHASWSQVPYAAGEITAIAYTNGQQVATVTRKTAGAAVALQASIKDGVGAAGLHAGCRDVALVQAFVVDKDGNVVPGAANDVTFTITTGDTSIAFIGSGNGDPTCHTDDKSMVRPAYHGKVLGVFQDIGMVGSATVTVSADGLKSDSVKIDVSDAGAVTGEWWCAAGNTL